MDCLLKWTEAYPLPKNKAVIIAEALVRDFFSQFGVPLGLHSDQRRNFESAVLQNMSQLLRIKKTRGHNQRAWLKR